MNRETFMRGVVVAFAFAALGATAFVALKPLFGSVLVVRWLIAACAGLYIVYLQSRSDEKAGRLAVPALWLLATIVAWYGAPTLVAFLLIEAAMIWLVRSLYFHGGVIAALLDLAVSAAGVLAAITAAQMSASVFLAIWSFFLVQALFCAIPAGVSASPAVAANTADDRFHRALAAAEAAVRRVHSH